MDSGQGSERTPVGADHEDAGYRLIAEQVRKYFGLDLAQYRYDQLHRRLMGFARRRNVKTLTQYAQLLDDDAQERNTFLHRFAINVSEFFRDAERWETLERDILPELMRDRGRVRVWSAGCSRGQEPYSLAMVLAEAGGTSPHHILATDIDSVALNHARAAGPYPEKEVRNISPARRERFLTRDEHDHWSAIDELRARVTYQRHDLLQDAMPIGFDMIVCRNVLIYFTAQTRARLFSGFSEALRPGGVLFIGATEALAVTQLGDLRPLSFGFYVREGERSYR